MKRFCNVCKIELIKGETWGKYTNFLCKPHNREYVLKYYYKQREKYILLTRERDKKNINNPKRREVNMEQKQFVGYALIVGVIIGVLGTAIDDGAGAGDGLYTIAGLLLYIFGIWAAVLLLKNK